MLHHNHGGIFMKRKFAFTLAEDTTCVAMSKDYRKAAFTLAEVLVTLGIIGIVAAMTMPVLIANHQKKETVAKLKKAYSILQQATIFAKQEYGEVNDWDYSDPYEFGQKYFKPYLKVIVDTQKEIYSWTDLTGNSHSYSTWPTLILADGTYIFIYLADPGYPVNFHIGVDINGKQKPNKLGRDLFLFTYYKNALRTYSQYETGMPNRNNVVYPGTSGQCNVDAQGGVMGPGSYCSTLIEMDGWEIKDDYPW